MAGRVSLILSSVGPIMLVFLVQEPSTISSQTNIWAAVAIDIILECVKLKVFA